MRKFDSMTVLLDKAIEKIGSFVAPATMDIAPPTLKPSNLTSMIPIAKRKQIFIFEKFSKEETEKIFSHIKQEGLTVGPLLEAVRYCSPFYIDFVVFEI